MCYSSLRSVTTVIGMLLESSVCCSSPPCVTRAATAVGYMQQCATCVYPGSMRSVIFPWHAYGGLHISSARRYAQYRAGTRTNAPVRLVVVCCVHIAGPASAHPLRNACYSLPHRRQLEHTSVCVGQLTLCMRFTHESRDTALRLRRLSGTSMAHRWHIELA